MLTDPHGLITIQSERISKVHTAWTKPADFLLEIEGGERLWEDAFLLTNDGVL